MDELIGEITRSFLELEESLYPKLVKRLELKLLKQTSQRMATFSTECKECETLLIDLNSYLCDLKSKEGGFKKIDLKRHKEKVKQIVSHLEKEHHLVREGYYLSTYMSFGMSLGIVFGLLLFDNIALGLSLGIAVGVILGSAKDAHSKKKDLTL